MDACREYLLTGMSCQSVSAVCTPHFLLVSNLTVGSTTNYRQKKNIGNCYASDFY